APVIPARAAPVRPLRFRAESLARGRSTEAARAGTAEGRSARGRLRTTNASAQRARALGGSATRPDGGDAGPNRRRSRGSVRLHAAGARARAVLDDVELDAAVGLAAG